MSNSIISKYSSESASRIRRSPCSLAIPAAVFLALVLGCGIIGGTRVPNEQIDQDLAKVNAKYPAYTTELEWMFLFVTRRCFSINKDESQFTDTGAKISLTVAAWRENSSYNDPIMRSNLSDLKPFETIFGKLLFHYKKDGDKWVFERFEQPGKMVKTDVDAENLKKFIDIAKPQCDNFEQSGRANPR
jgi:hypothetical protein